MSWKPWASEHLLALATGLLLIAYGIGWLP